MDLKEILIGQGLSEEQYEAVAAAMKDNKIYLSGEENIDIRYSKLKGEHDTKLQELQGAQDLIKQLQEASANNEDVQSKITEYENQIKILQEEAAKAKLDFAIRTGLLEKGVLADSMDFLLYKINQDNKELKFGEGDKLEGIDFEEVKTKYASHFKAEEGNGEKKFDPNGLPIGDKQETAPTSLADALKMKYTNQD